MDFAAFDSVSARFDPVILAVNELEYEFAKVANRHELELSYQSLLKDAADDVARARSHFVDGVRELAIDEVVIGAQDNAERISAAIERAAAENGARLVGLEHRLKGRASLARKVDSEISGYVTGGQVSVEAIRIASASIHDGLRFTMVLGTDTFVEDYWSVEGSLRAAGMSFTRVSNTFDNDKDSYRGVNANLVDGESGYCFELQFHTDRSWEAKGEAHPHYEVVRNPQRHSPEEVAAAFAAMRAIFGRDNVIVPEGIGSISDFQAGR